MKLDYQILLKPPPETFWLDLTLPSTQNH